MRPLPFTSRILPGSGASVGPLRLADIDRPELPGDDWVRVVPDTYRHLRLRPVHDRRTFVGLLRRKGLVSRSFPDTKSSGTPTEPEWLEPVLGPEARGEELAFAGAAPGDGDDYGYLLGGSIDDGIQVGFCASTGGGWGEEFVAHRGQLHAVPDDVSDEDAVMLEPAAGGVHAAAKAQIDGGVVLVQGAGTMGLVTIAALRAYTNADTIIAVAKYPIQKQFAAELGADVVVGPSETKRAVRRVTGCRMLGDDLSGGADVTIDAIGNATSIETAIGVDQTTGKGCSGRHARKLNIDLTALWHRETELIGAYTYGTDAWPDGTSVSSFTRAMELTKSAQLGRLVSAKYPLTSYKEAIRHAAEAGQRGSIKVTFAQ